MDKFDVALIVPPVTDGNVPSLAMSLLKSCLAERGIKSFVDYADIRFYVNMGKKDALIFQSIYQVGHIGEYIFLPLVGWKAKGTREDYLQFINRDDPFCGRVDMAHYLELGELVARKTLEETVEKIIDSGVRIVGVMAQFQQLNASAAILKRVKEIRPDIVTMIGGAHCMDIGGTTILRHWNFVDYVYFGEADEIIGEVCEKILSEDHNFSLPYGVMRHGEPIPEEFQHRRTQNMNTLPYPDYSDYFALEELYADFYKDNTFFELNVIILEGSRGCWWGAKNPCTFCGLNGHVRVYREKNSERFAEEICSLSDKWQQVKYINFSDSILSQRHMKELPELLTRKLTRKIIFMTEIKSNISEKELFGLAVAGFHSIQPGIESLNDDILRIMNKGNNALNHIALLRYARKFHVNTIWNFLHAFPGEPATAYEESEKLLPLLYHLQPPNIFGRIQYQRSSVYCNEPEKYGLDLRPNHVYDYVMPNDEDYINGLAYNFEDHAEKPLPEVYSRMTNLINKWRYQWQRKARERLEMELFNEMGGSIEIRDTRMCSTNIYHTLIGIKNLIYRDADIPISRKALEKKYGEAASAAINELIADKLMIEMKGKVLALAVETTWKSKRKSSWLSKISDRKLSDSCSS